MYVALHHVFVQGSPAPTQRRTTADVASTLRQNILESARAAAAAVQQQKRLQEQQQMTQIPLPVPSFQAHGHGALLPDGSSSPREVPRSRQQLPTNSSNGSAGILTTGFQQQQRHSVQQSQASLRGHAKYVPQPPVVADDKTERTRAWLTQL